MREAKQVRKIKKRNDKAMKRRSIEKDMVLPVSSENETKKVRYENFNSLYQFI